MDDAIDTLMIDVRASTDGFRADIDTMRGMVDRQLLDGFTRAGSVLERGLLSAVRNGNLGFDDLRRTALQALNEIAANALKIGLGNVGAGSTGAGGVGNLLSGVLTSVLGLPGRATGGPVSPGRAFMVGERGPEMFVPTSAGRIETLTEPRGRGMNLSINVPRSAGETSPVALRRSARQVASFVRRAMDGG